jgi:AraC family transcriptional regulator
LGKVARVESSSRYVTAAVARRRQTGTGGSVSRRTLVSGDGWRIVDVVCTCDADDRSGEEQHSHYSMAMVLAGAFHYRGPRGSALLPAGSILIGRAGAPFTCWHEFGAGDRCLSIQFEAEAFGDVLASNGVTLDAHALPVAVPVDRRTAGMFAAAELLASSSPSSDEGLSVAVAMVDRVVQIATSASFRPVKIRNAGKVLELVRWIETDPAAEHHLPALAARAGLSKYHLVRLFRQVVGIPPHAFIKRARLRSAAIDLASRDESVLEVAMRAGFPDVSTFNASFKKQFGASPRTVRQRVRTSGRYAELSMLERDAMERAQR